MARFNYRLVARLLGMLLIIMACSMVVPVLVSLFYADGSQFGLMLSALLMLIMGLFLRNFVGIKSSYELRVKESFWITAIIWIVVPLAGALPYLFTSVTSSFTDAAFESFSGFTTTGSSVLADVDHTPYGLLVWRSTSQWVGGMGLILFVVAILHRLNEGSARLYEAEFSGSLQRRLHPRMAKNVVLMWTVYMGLTVAMILLLLAGGNTFVDSLCLAMSTVSTGGFMTHTDGLASLSAYSTVIVTVFMFLAGINLALLFYFFTGRWRQMRGEEELKRYIVMYFAAVAVCAISFVVGHVRAGHPLGAGDVGDFISFSFFHVASTVSTCGFYTTTPTFWPMMVSVVTFLLMCVGASAGSTGGGLKIKRIMILGRHVRNYLVRMVHPRAVLSVKIGRGNNMRVVDEEYVNRIIAFIFLYFLFIVIGAFVLTLCGLNIPNALCMAAANISNLGPSPVINNWGASLDYIQLQAMGKWTVMVLMLAGRLEIFALVAMVLPAYWRRL